jgi:hypothetical protein
VHARIACEALHDGHGKTRELLALARAEWRIVAARARA